MHYWLLKTEPDDFSYADLARGGQEIWDGVRSRHAQSYLRRMLPGDLAFIYHTGKEKAVIGVADVVTGAIPDPTDPAWTAVTVAARYRLPHAVTLKEIKQAQQLAGWLLVRQPRLSVMPVTNEEWHHVLLMAAQ